MSDGPPEVPTSADGLPPSAGPQMWNWMREVYLEPEIVRRMDAGKLEEGTAIHRAQVVFRVEEAPEVRLNGEVEGRLEVKVVRAVEKGEEITIADIGTVSGYLLPEEDADAAHVTMFVTSTGMDLVFDGAYNTRLIESQLKVADQFIAAAEVTLEAAALHAFAENAFAATELLARAELLWLPDPRVYGAKTHRTPRNLYNQWANLGNTEQRFATLLNFLTELRNSARYGHSKFSLSPGKATECQRRGDCGRAKCDRSSRECEIDIARPSIDRERRG